MLSPKGSSGTCIPEGQTTFPHAACTAHDVLDPGHEVLHAAGEFCVADVPHRGNLSERIAPPARLQNRACGRVGR